MREQEGHSTKHPKRLQTDASLRKERAKADLKFKEAVGQFEKKMDKGVKLARRRADAVLELSRADADRSRVPASVAPDILLEQERIQADVLLKRERGNADAATDRERAERQSYLAGFLLVERDETDRDLIGERAHADVLIVTRDEFLAIISHDLRNLLTGLSLNIEQVIRSAPLGPSGDKARKHANASQRLAIRMDRMVGDLLDVARIETGTLDVFPEQVALKQVLGDIFDDFEPLAAAQRYTSCRRVFGCHGGSD